MHIDQFKEHFESITDQHQGAKVTYYLFEVLFDSLCTAIARAKGWFDTLGHHDWFARNNMFLMIFQLMTLSQESSRLLNLNSFENTLLTGCHQSIR